MIKVDLGKINTNIKNLTKYKGSFSTNYNEYYRKTEYSSDYWVGKYATKFYDFQLGNKSTNQKMINNVDNFLEVVNYTYDKYSKIISKNIKIELDQERSIEEQYKKIISSVRDAIEYLNSLENIDAGSVISQLGWCNDELDKSKEKTLKMFKDVSESEEQIRIKANAIEVKKIVPLEIDSYMVN